MHTGREQGVGSKFTAASPFERVRVLVCLELIACTHSYRSEGSTVLPHYYSHGNIKPATHPCTASTQCIGRNALQYFAVICELLLSILKQNPHTCPKIPYAQRFQNPSGSDEANSSWIEGMGKRGSSLSQRDPS